MKNVELGTQRLTPQTNPEPEPSPRPVSTELLSAEQIEQVRTKIVDVLCSCFDPEIPVNIYELGLIYGVDIEPSGAVQIRMTLTSPACPVAGSLVREVEYKVTRLPEIRSAKVDLVWDPPWDKSRMSDAAKLQLGLDD
jgi:FeS assembly SUF system protein